MFEKQIKKSTTETDTVIARTVETDKMPMGLDALLDILPDKTNIHGAL